MLNRVIQYAPVTAKGILMGAADIIPGVSGGTIAFITGIYEALINALQSINGLAFKKLFRMEVRSFWQHINGNFLLSLLIGIVISIVTLANTIIYLLEHHSMLLFSFFFGLILASAVIIAGKARTHSVSSYLSGAAGILVALLITSLSPVTTPETWWFIFLSGIIAITAMILPGISGSFILLLLGKYTYILNAVREFDIITIAIFVTGCAVGLTGFSRILSKLLHNFHDQTMLLLAGFMLGSLTKVWPWQIPGQAMADSEKALLFSKNVLPGNFHTMTNADPQLLPVILLMVTGVGLVLILELTAGRKQGALKQYSS
ncbi:MAG: DUF368 domain-containing protein [Prosthecochloris sp.]|uniref:Integral membrane protein n=1 Tax=Prosthecochloris aestuarii (strain DSM 271 / SK 413) TaxID=290512 RepID=B4S6J5_PROA2|nr:MULTISPECIES: DUF368 domain-containing protein [Prosthecochloris]ACF45750.1 protein of unknown function DUF368 [Prosthecochloris aestuarii DSM 271]MCW8798738.1 DUF368 domain-containing protein [Prosthecochloris sp.]NEX12128.1 DUF368 domain-containing protein [Prosthecochloris sp.]RDD30732.1 DUF368 domain-containing protein [Prosthecochloris sp. ZM]